MVSNVRICNMFTANELKNSLRPDWSAKLLQFFRSHPKLRRVNHTSLTPWYFHRDRKISIALHRLRCDHNRSKAHTSRYHIHREDDPDNNYDPWCRYDCAARENSSHILISGPHFLPSRGPLLNLFHRLKLPFDLDTILGYQNSVPNQTQ